MEVIKSCIVRSEAGRDKNGLFLVLDVGEDGYVLVANGRNRKTEAPKRKKLKHVSFVAENHTRTREKILNGETPTNSETRKSLAEFSGASAKL